MASVKKIMQQKLAVWMILIVVLAVACFVVADSNQEHDNNNNNNEVISRKLMKLEPQPNCGEPGAYCDLAPANWCCGTLECKRNPGITDWSGTCVQGACNGVGQPCYTPPPVMSYACCWDLKCVNYLCQKAGSTTSEEAGIMMIGSA